MVNYRKVSVRKPVSLRKAVSSVAIEALDSHGNTYLLHYLTRNA